MSILGRLGASWERLGRVVGASWGPLGASWAHLGAPWAPFWAGLGRVVPRLGTVFGRLGAVLSALKRVPFKTPSFDRFFNRIFTPTSTSGKLKTIDFSLVLLCFFINSAS